MEGICALVLVLDGLPAIVRLPIRVYKSLQEDGEGAGGVKEIFLISADCTAQGCRHAELYQSPFSEILMSAYIVKCEGIGHTCASDAAVITQVSKTALLLVVNSKHPISRMQQPLIQQQFEGEATPGAPLLTCPPSSS